MAKAETKLKEPLKLVPAAPPVIRCRDCRYWRGDVGQPIAECGLSGRWLSAPAMTTDMTTCSKAEARV